MGEDRGSLVVAPVAAPRGEGRAEGQGRPPPWALPRTSVYRDLDSSPRGLSDDEAAARLARCGPNELPRSRRRPVVLRFGAQFTDLFAVVLMVAAGITLLAYAVQSPREVGNLQLAVAILAVVVMNAVIGFVQEYSAERTVQALQAMVPGSARVLRDGERTEVPVPALVPGDVVVLEAGDAVSADCRLVEVHTLSVNNMALTGESEPVGRTGEAADPALHPLDARNCVFMGTTVAGGTGKGVVYATGSRTEFGRVVRLTAEVRPERSPLQRQMASMARRVSAAALGTGALLFVVRAGTGGAVVTSFLFALGVMVALVPEGLPATLSVSLAIGVRRMARHQALIKKLVAVETLGATTVICTDKTGTLTKAEMTAQVVWASGRPHAISGVGYAPVGDVEDASAVRKALRVAALCSDARLLPPGDDGQGWRVLGDTTEGAILVAAAKAGVDLAEEERRTPRVAEFPFDSARKLMSTVHRVDGRLAAYVKGSPQELLTRCVRISWNGRSLPLDEDRRRVVTVANDTLAATGLRVLGVCWREVASERVGHQEAETGLTFGGLIGMIDPPRPEVTEAVTACRRAGIRIVMVTGDHGLTAEAVARRVGIVRGRSQRVVAGAELETMDDAALVGTLRDYPELIFARVRPEHKMRVVGAFQSLGAVVAVTGDGANDAPALHRADIGVAMGASGTDVAREAAVMVLLDDSFASIAAAVELGRSVYQNIRKFLTYLFSHNVAELTPILAATAVGFPLTPLTALQVLAIDLGSDVLPALALGAERPEPGVMDRPPRAAAERLFSAGLVRRFLFLGSIQSLGVVVAFFWRIHSAGIPFASFTADNPVYREALTMTYAGIVVSQFFNGLTVRTEEESIVRVGLLGNVPLLAAECLGIAMVTAVSYLPALQAVFNTAPLSLSDWVLLAAFGVLLLLADESRKAWVRAGRRRSPQEAGRKGAP